MTGTDTTALWTEFHRPLGAFLAKRVRRDADVEDVIQEVFARIHRSIDTLQRSERVSAWIFQIARNALIDFQRARATRADATTAIQTSSSTRPLRKPRMPRPTSRTREPVIAACRSPIARHPAHGARGPHAVRGG